MQKYKITADKLQELKYLIYSGYEIDEVNHYNTRPAAMAGKLPVGPICSPSKDSISATVKPTKHDYYFFVADKTGMTHFTKTNAEHNAKIAELKNDGLWYVYE